MPAAPTRLLFATLWLFACQAQALPRATVLLVHDAVDALSVLDARGIREALQEQRVPFEERALAVGQTLSGGDLVGRPVLILAHVAIDANEARAIIDFVEAGGGLFASGRSGFGLESLLGISGLQTLARFPSGGPPADAIRFATAHNVATGSFWSGPINQTPPMPASEMPAIPQLLYTNPTWPAYTATPAGAQALARWRNSAAAWNTPDQSPVVFVNSAGAGRTVYSGALAGSYADGAWPLSWRGLIQEAVDWIDQRSAQVRLGYWPDGHSSAFALSADTERAPMTTVVPALLSMFDRLGLADFGTFFVVGQAGGDPLTEGAFEHPEVVEAIIAAGSEVGGHGDVHTRFAGQSLAVQSNRISTMRGLLEAHTDGHPVLGFRAPGLAIDRDTRRALAATGLAYDSSDQDVWCECALPWFNGEVWSLPPTSPMDYALLYTQGLLDSEWQSITLDKFRYMASRRGLVNWVVHPWLVEHRLATVEALLAEVRDDGGYWMTRLDRILDWWIRRDDLRLDVAAADNFHLRVLVDNTGPDAVDGATLWLRLPPSEYPWRAQVDGQAQPLGSREHGLARPEHHDTLVIPRIGAGGSAWVELVVDRPAEIFDHGFEN